MLDPIADLATVPAVPLHPAIAEARAAILATVASLLGVRDDQLDGPWRWRPGDPDDIEARYAWYRIHELLESASGIIEVGRSERPGAPMGAAIPALGAMTTARWELHGVLVALTIGDWDSDPGDGEWTIRQAMAHIVGGQRGYGWYNAWYVRHPLPVGEAVQPPESAFPVEPTEEEDAIGSPGDVTRALDALVDAVIIACAGLDHAALTIGARWAGLPVTMDFRFGRYASHIREHTVQIDKTLAMLDRRPTEVERLARLILSSYGRLEALAIGRLAAELERPIVDGSSAIGILAAAISDCGATATSVRAAIG